MLAKLCNVPSALIMRRNPSTMEVMSTSKGADSPYEQHELAPLNKELYCETVIDEQKALNIPNALKDPEWDKNPDIKLGMISYYGVPLNWPGGDPFGTICVLDSVERHLTEDQKQIIFQFGQIIETSLELETANQQLKRLTEIDGLTQIANRRAFDAALDREWSRSRREKAPLSLLLCDIDRFKDYNDFNGHLKGDQALKSIAKTLEKIPKRATDLCSRYGGEEFVLLLPNTDQSDALLLAEQCLKSVRNLNLLYDNDEKVLSTSIGVRTITATKDIKPSSIIEQADIALYRAKENGRSRVELFHKI